MHKHFEKLFILKNECEEWKEKLRERSHKEYDNWNKRRGKHPQLDESGCEILPAIIIIKKCKSGKEKKEKAEMHVVEYNSSKFML
jgi:hypothetical protein